MTSILIIAEVRKELSGLAPVCKAAANATAARDLIVVTARKALSGAATDPGNKAVTRPVGSHTNKTNA